MGISHSSCKQRETRRRKRLLRDVVVVDRVLARSPSSQRSPCSNTSSTSSCSSVTASPAMCVICGTRVYSQDLMQHYVERHFDPEQTKKHLRYEAAMLNWRLSGASSTERPRPPPICVLPEGFHPLPPPIPPRNNIRPARRRVAQAMMPLREHDRRRLSPVQQRDSGIFMDDDFAEREMVY